MPSRDNAGGCTSVLLTADHVAVLAGARVVGVGCHADGGLGASLDITIDTRRARTDAIVAALDARQIGGKRTGAFAAIAAVVTERIQSKRLSLGLVETQDRRTVNKYV